MEHKCFYKMIPVLPLINDSNWVKVQKKLQKYQKKLQIYRLAWPHTIQYKTKKRNENKVKVQSLFWRNIVADVSLLLSY